MAEDWRASGPRGVEEAHQRRWVWRGPWRSFWDTQVQGAIEGRTN